MNKKQEQKAETHRRMTEAASRRFREFGFGGVGVDGIAKAAGATSGALYAHFGSKAGAFEAALEAGLDEVIDRMPQFQAEHGADWVRAFADYYLGAAHRNDLACGCAMTALSPDVARGNARAQAIYARKMEAIARIAAAGLNGSDAERLERAWAMLSVLIGGLTIARALNTAPAAEAVSAAAHAAARGVASGEV